MQTEINVPKEVLDRLDALAAKVGTTVENLWPELVRREFALAVGSFVTQVVFFLFFAVMANWIIRRGIAVGWPKRLGEEGARWERGFQERAVPLFILGGVLSVATIITTVNLIPSVPWCVANIASPEAAALRSLLGK